MVTDTATSGNRCVREWYVGVASDLLLVRLLGVVQLNLMEDVVVCEAAVLSKRQLHGDGVLGQLGVGVGRALVVQRFTGHPYAQFRGEAGCRRAAGGRTVFHGAACVTLTLTLTFSM